MITPEEREGIITEAIERALLAIPEVIGNLIASHVSLTKANKKFYSDYPELAEDKNLVASVVELVDSKNPGVDYEELLKKALPEIRERIKLTSGIDTASVSRPEKRDLDLNIDLNSSDHGEL